MKFKYEKYNVGANIVRPHTMEQYLKFNQKGITIISLIITIIIMLILASVTINVGTDSIDKSQMINFVTCMQTIQSKVDFIVENENYMNYGEEVDSNNKQLFREIINNGNETFLTNVDSKFLRFFDSSHIASDLEAGNIDDEIIVDFNTREVISLNGVKYENKMYYTQYNLPGGQKLKQKTQETNRNISFGEIRYNIDGLNATFIITDVGVTNGTLYYGKKNSSNEINWITAIDYTIKGESVITKNITESGTYYFKLVDNITGADNGTIDDNGNVVYTSVELKLTNTPKLKGKLTDLSKQYNYSNLNDSTQWAFATDSTDASNVKYYVWIPRFAYKVDIEGNIVKDENNKVILEFLRGTSDITTSGGYINATEWTVPDVFTKEGDQKTGVWVQVSSAKQKDLDIIDILETGTIL